MIGGWHDIFLPWQLRDYAALRAAGARPHLTIGAWTHGSPGLLVASLRESIDWLRAHLRGEPPAAGAAGAALRRGRRLARLRRLAARRAPRATVAPAAGTAGSPRNRAATSTPDTLRYDPTDPTPTVGGPLLLANVSGPRDNRALEARPDVLVYTVRRCGRPRDHRPGAGAVHVRAVRPLPRRLRAALRCDRAGR